MNEKWVVTHATENGATRMWWVDGDVAKFLLDQWDVIGEGPYPSACCVRFRTLTGRALIWLTPGQSLTVERSNG